MEARDGKTLQMFYAALMVDAAVNFERFGIAEKVAEKKEREQAAAAPRQLAQLGIQKPTELFARFAEIFGCADWHVTEGADGSVHAVTPTCLACGIAKARGAGGPCALYCINPFRALAGALTPSRRLVVEETLWEGRECRFALEG